MTVLLALDKFKGSLTAREVVEHLGRGLTDRGVPYRGLPLADGGDGSVAAAIDAGFTPVEIDVVGPTGLPRRAFIAVHDDTAVVEVATVCGLAALPGGTQEPLLSSTYGVGLAARAALSHGVRRLVLAAGGSASTDGGAGFLAALGMTFYDTHGRSFTPDGGTLADVVDIDTASLIDLSGIDLVLAADVRNPLADAAPLYGPQKGADPDQVRHLDAGLKHLVDQLAAARYPDASCAAQIAGAGCAGGLGFAGLLVGGRIQPGAEFFLDLLGFSTTIVDCDTVITGEGRIDKQTRHGKLPAAVARRSGHRPVIAVVGRRAISQAELDSMGIQQVYALADHTEDDPAADAALSARLLRKLGRTITLPTPPRLRY